jgi:tripartite-type tricarboxylate transporter receptor subunit TctC
MMVLGVGIGVASLAVLLNVDMALGQTFPSKPVRIVATGVGGSGDFAARLIAQGLVASWAQPVIVDNRGDGTIAAASVMKALPDGHTLLINGSNLWLLQFLREKVAWDPLKDFTAVTLAVNSPNMVVVTPSLPAKSVKELIALARAKPGALNYGTSGTGTSNHMAGELFKSMAGIDIVRVNYKGTDI